jgi:hypothetical protein
MSPPEAFGRTVGVTPRAAMPYKEKEDPARKLPVSVEPPCLIVIVVIGLVVAVM